MKPHGWYKTVMIFIIDRSWLWKGGREVGEELPNRKREKHLATTKLGFCLHLLHKLTCTYSIHTPTIRLFVETEKQGQVTSMYVLGIEY